MVDIQIMGEFVEGYEKLAAIGPCISIFGSARTHQKISLQIGRRYIASNC